MYQKGFGVSIQTITQSLAKEQAELLDRYIKYEMKRLGLTLEDLKDYELKKEVSPPVFTEDKMGVKSVIKYQLVKKEK